MTERTSIVVFMGVNIRLRRATAKDDINDGFSRADAESHYILYRVDTGETLAWVNENDLFDTFGNRFEH